MANAIENLLHILEVIRLAAPADPACRWFESGLQEYLQLGGPRLDEALGLRRSSNGRTTTACWLYLQRDKLVCSAIARCGGVNEFLDQLCQFELREWQTVQRLTAPPKKWSALRRALFAAKSCGVPIPRGRRRLQQIATDGEMSSRSGCADIFALNYKLDRKKMATR